MQKILILFLQTFFYFTVQAMTISHGDIQMRLVMPLTQPTGRKEGGVQR